MGIGLGGWAGRCEWLWMDRGVGVDGCEFGGVWV